MSYKFNKYNISIEEDCFQIYIREELIFEFDVRSRVNCEIIDRDEVVLFKSERYENGNLDVVWTTRSNIWEKKEYVLRCEEECFYYYVRVYGKGAVEKIEFFSSDYRCNKYETSEYFTPVAPHYGKENRYFTMTENFRIELGYMVPPPLCYSFSVEGMEEKVGIALTAKPGSYCFDSYEYRFDPQKQDFVFTTDYYGYMKADGMFETCGILGVFGKDDWEILREYTEWHFERGGCKRREGKMPAWWHGPLFCGWGEQCTLAKLSGKTPFELATQSEYERMSVILSERDLRVTAIIIDDKWQKYYGEALPDRQKWPDLRRFVDKEHAKGRKVLLWFKVWNNEGLRDEEQVQYICRPVAPDPTNPLYRERVRKMMHTLLSDDAECFNCDGFKLDFANCMPLGKDLQIFHKGVYGIELLKSMMKLIYEESKAVKTECLINNSCCHPYFAEITDQVRLHDYSQGVRNAEKTLYYRGKVYKTVMPDALIDTDSPNFESRRDTMRYFHSAASIGVLDLYTLSSSVLTEADYQEIGQMFRQ